MTFIPCVDCAYRFDTATENHYYLIRDVNASHLQLDGVKKAVLMNGFVTCCITLDLKHQCREGFRC